MRLPSPKREYSRKRNDLVKERCRGEEKTRNPAQKKKKVPKNKLFEEGGKETHPSPDS